MMERKKVLDVYVNDISVEDAVNQIVEWSREDGCHQIVTADAYMANLANVDPDFRSLMNSADLVTPDSSGIILASRLSGDPISRKASGCVIAEQLCRVSGRQGLRIFFFGASEKANAGAVENMLSKYPDLQVAGRRNGYFDPAESPAIAREIRESGANVLLVALGIPKQEYWIREYLPDTGAKAAIGIGGTFDVMSGNVKRAPVFLQNLYLEWLYRFLQAPKKSYKLGCLPGFFLKVLLNRNSHKDNHE